MKQMMILISLIACLDLTSETISKDINAAWQKSISSDHSLERREPQAWFLGYVEGKTGAMPTFWRQAILDLDQSRLPDFSPNVDSYDWPYHRSGGKDLPKTISIQRKDSEVVLRVNDESVHIDSLLWKEITFGSAGLAALATANKVYLVAHDSTSGPIDIFSYDRVNRALVWKSTTKPNKYSPNRPSGVGFHHAEIMVRNENLFIFGICDNLAYVVCHEEATGKHLWKFSTDDSK